MTAYPADPGHLSDDQIAELTEAAYRVALPHVSTGSFVCLQLDIWYALRGVLARWESTSQQAAQR